MDRRLSFRTLNRRLRAIVGHGVVSTGSQRRGRWVSAPGDYATFNSNHTPDGTYMIRVILEPGVIDPLYSVVVPQKFSYSFSILDVAVDSNGDALNSL